MIGRCVALLVLVFCLCGGAAMAQQPAGPTTAKLSKPTPARGVRDGEPVDASDVFAPDAGPIHVWYRVSGHAAPLALRGTWRYLGPGRDRIIMESESVVQATDDWGSFQLELPPGTPWPIGSYRLDIAMGDQPPLPVPFRVAIAPVKAAAPTPATKAVPKTVAAAPDTPVPAQPSRAARPITVDSVEALLSRDGYRPQRQVRSDGVPYLQFQIEGWQVGLILFDCTPGPCSDALLRSGFETPWPIRSETINAWNRDQRLVRAYLDAEGDPILDSDLVVVDADIQAVQAWLANWRETLPKFVAHLARQGGR